MRYRFLTVMTGALLFTLSFAIMAAQRNAQAETMMAAARQKAILEGDLDAAIQQYNEIVSQYSKSDPATAADALLRIAEAYRTKGDSEARKVYERIVRDFPEQKDAVKTAQDQLAIETTLRVASQAPRLVCSGSDCLGPVSPNGRFVAFNGLGGVHIKNLMTSETRKVDSVSAFDNGGEKFLWSPDSERLAFITSPERLEVHVVRTDGTEQPIVRSMPMPLGWSTDGKELLVVQDATLPSDLERAPSGEQRGGNPANAVPRNLVWVNVASGATRHLAPMKLLPLPEWGSARVSPDGRHIALTSSGRTYIIASNGSNEVLVAGSDRIVASPIDWTPDGKHLLFMAWTKVSPYMRNIGAPGAVWSVAISEGRPQGVPSVVISERKKLVAASLTRNGSLHFRLSNELALSQSSSSGPGLVYTASFDSTRGVVTSAPEILPLPGQNSPSETTGGPVYWSPDGKRLLYARQKDNTQVFSIYSLDSRNEQRIAGATARTSDRFCWSADASSIIFHKAETTKDADEIVRLNLRTSAVETLLPSGTPFSLNSCSGDLISDNSPNVRIRNLKTGAETVVPKPSAEPQTNAFTPSRLSHDGRSIAFLSESGTETFQTTGGRGGGGQLVTRTQAVNALYVATMDGGRPKELVRGRSAILPNNTPNSPTFTWSPDDRFVYYVKIPSGSNTRELFRVAVGGGPEQSTGLRASGNTLGQIEISPDGKHILFRADRQPEIWAIDNFNPASK